MLFEDLPMAVWGMGLRYPTPAVLTGCCLVCGRWYQGTGFESARSEHSCVAGLPACAVRPILVGAGDSAVEV